MKTKISTLVLGLALGVGAANPVYVNCSLADYTGHDGSTPEKALATIQQGVDAASAGATVHVAAGVYSNGVTAATENFAACRVYITKNLTLKGAGRDVTHIVGAYANTSTNIGPGAVAGIVISSGSNANLSRIEGFTIRDCGDSKKSNGGNGAGTAIQSLKVGSSLTMADRPWVVDCAVSNICASVGAVSYVNVARTIFMNCEGHNFASVADYSDLVYCLVAHNQQVLNHHLFRGTRTEGEKGNRIVNCTIVDSTGSNSSINLMSTTAPYYLQNSITDLGGVFSRELDSCVFSNARGKFGASSAPVSETSTNETATSFFNRADKVVASVVTDDFRPITPCDLVADAPAYYRGNTNNLSAFPEEFRWRDVYGQTVVPNDEGRIHAGAVQTAMTPVAGFLIKALGQQLRVNGRSFCRSTYTWSDRTVLTDVWPTMYRLEFPRTNELVAAGLSMPFFAFLITDDGTADRNVFPDSNERLPFVPAKGRVTSVAPRLATHVVYVDRAAENGNSDTGSGTETTPFARIQKAINSVPMDKDNRAVIYVAPGTYDCDLTARSGYNPATRVNLNRNKTYYRVIGTGGAERTIIPGAADTSEFAIEGCLSTNAIRCLRCGSNSAAIQGFTLTGGHTAGKDEGKSGNSYGRGGAFLADNTSNAWMIECIVTNNYAYYGGAALANGNAVKCYFADNHIVGSGSLFDYQNTNGVMVVSSCVINETNLNTKGTMFLQNSKVPGYVVNCSVRGNSNCHLFDTNSYTFFVNSILTHAKSQKAGSGYRRTSGTYVWEFDYKGGCGNALDVTYYKADPEFVDPENGDFHILRTSPAYGGGDAWTKMSKEGTTWDLNQVYKSYYRFLSCDMEGNFPIFVNGNPSAGAYQVASKMKMDVTANVPGEVSVTPAVGTSTVEVDEPLTVTATSTTRPIVGIEVNGTLFAGSSATFIPGELATTSLSVAVIASTNWYVDAVNGNDANTGWTEETACRTLTGVLAKTASGDVVTALPGTYDEGSSLHTDVVYDKWNYKMTNDTIRLPSRAVVPDGVALVSRDGAEATVIKGEFGSGTDGVGEGAVRCVFLGRGAVLKGFTVTGGGTLAGPTEYKYEFFDNVAAGGILSADLPVSSSCGWQPIIKGYAENCIISNNTSQGIGAAYFGSYINCLFTKNLRCALREPNYLYGCVVDDNATGGVGYSIYQPYYVDNCTFLGTDHKKDGSAVCAIYCYPGQSYWVTRNSLFLGTKANTLKWVFNCRFQSEDLLVNRNDGKHCWENVVYDSTLAVAENYRPVRTCSAVDAWADGYTAVSNVFKYATPVAALRETDFAGGQRVYNGALDVGAGECDWRPRYATVLGGGARHQVTLASTNVVEVETGVQLTDGQMLTSAFTALQCGSRQCEWQIAQTGSGTLIVSVNGGEPQVVTDTVFSPTVQKGTNTFAFSYAGEGSAVLQRFAHFNGTMLIFR